MHANPLARMYVLPAGLLMLVHFFAKCTPLGSAAGGWPGLVDLCNASRLIVSSICLPAHIQKVREAPQEHDGALRPLLAEREGG